MIKPIIQIGNPILSVESSRVAESEISSPEFKKLTQDMLDTVKQEGLNSVGLSAVQIGVAKRVCVCRRVDLSKKERRGADIWEIMINPEIKLLPNSKRSLLWEGCLSIGEGDAQLFGPVTRVDEIEVSYTTMDSKHKRLKLDGYMSHVVQHEVDHMNGVLFLSYISNPDNIWRSDELDRYISKYGSYPEIK